jgi:hypothetical protein
MIVHITQEVVFIFLSYTSKKKEVQDFLDRLKILLKKEDFDIDDANPPILFVFGKDIYNKLVYVKLKIKGDQQRHVLCVSFHYAKEKMTFPYA